MANGLGDIGSGQITMLQQGVNSLIDLLGDMFGTWHNERARCPRSIGHADFFDKQAAILEI